MRPVALVIGGTLFAAACGGGASPGPAATWEVQHREPGGALVSVWASGPTDVWAVGGQVDRGLVLHGDGASWTAVQTGAPSFLWWAYGFSPSDIYAVGEEGLILHYDGASWERVESGTTRHLYGVWGSSADDVWIVGGDPLEPGGAVVLRGAGRTFQIAADLPAELAPSALFKAYGFAADDVVLVGSAGTVLRWDGASWRRDATPTDQPLFSLWGRGRDDIYAVGGSGVGTVLHFDGGAWTEIAGDELNGLSGVYTAPHQPTIAVGSLSYVLEIQSDGSEVEPELPAVDPLPELHGVWGDGTGLAYAVGGDLLAYPGPMTGVVFRRR
jgi:hypothetical protein